MTTGNESITVSSHDEQTPKRGVPGHEAVQIGHRFPGENGRYLIRDEIQAGGMGVVYEATDTRLSRTIAIKVIRPNILSANACDRFTNEARSMAQIDEHPGIARIYDCENYTDPNTGAVAPFITMEYVPGAQPLSEYVRSAKLSPRRRLEMFARVCDAVGAAHERGLIHRDLKPDNILVSSSGQPKIIDFGLALARRQSEMEARLPSEKGGLFGTLEYMSPEQAAKQFDPHALTTSSDVYALGVIMYELMTGRAPYPRKPSAAIVTFTDGTRDFSEARRIIREVEPPAPRKVDPRIHPALERIMLRALKKDPLERYASARDLTVDIDRYLRGAKRSDIRLATPVVVLAVVLAYLIGIPAFVRWTPIDSAYQAVVNRVLPAVTEFSRVVLVTGSNSTKLENFGELPGTPRQGLGFGAGERHRPLWGAVCRKLSESGCSTVAFDSYIDSDAALYASDDDDLISGFKAVQSHGIDLVVATGVWEDRVQAQPRALRETNPALGSIWMYAQPEGWVIDAVLKRRDVVLPSFSLQAAALARRPQQRLNYLIGELQPEVHVQHAPRGSETLKDDDEPIRLNGLVRGDQREVSEPGVETEDMYTSQDWVGLIYLPPFPAQSAIDRATVDAGELMQLSGPALRDRLGGKVVVLANTHTDHDDEWAKTPDGRRVPKSFGHALAIESILSGRGSVESLGGLGGLLFIAAASAIGGCIAVVCVGRVWQSLGWSVLVAAAIFIGSLAMVRYAGVVCNPLGPTLAMLVSAVCASVAPVVIRTLGR